MLISATGQAVISVPCSTKERAERVGKRPLSRPPASQAGIPHAVGKGQRYTGNGSAFASEVAQAEPGPRKQPFACVPHADGFVGLLDVPGLRAAAPAPRSCVLTPGHSLVPSAPFAVVRPVHLLWTLRSAEDIQGRQSLRTSAPRSTPAGPPPRAPYRYGTSLGYIILVQPSRTK